MASQRYSAILAACSVAPGAIAGTSQTTAQAAGYSLAGDFSHTDNRADSVWSFRLIDGARQPPAFLPLLTATNRNAKALWGPDFATPPAMWSEGSGYWGIGKNTTGVAQTGSGVTWAPGEVLLHPKGGAAPAGLAIVWTAPTGMVLDVNYTFSRCMAQGNGVGYELIKRGGGNDVVLANDAVGSSLTRTLSGVSVAAGDQLVFRFDTLGDPSGDITKAAIEITPAAGPAVAVTPVTVTPSSGLVLWYNQPAARWLEALPVGNGRLGGMVFGGVDVERLQLNEVSVWSGSPQDSDNPEALAVLPKIRRLLLDGKYDQAKDLSARKLICKGVGTRGAASANDPFGCFQTLGDLTLKFDAQGGASNYRRTLDIETAVTAVSYRLGDATFKREVFASAPDQALVVRLTCDKPGKIGFSANLTRPERFATAADGSDGLVMRGQLNDGHGGTNGLNYIARIKAVADGGTVNTDGNNLRVAGANSVTLFLTAGTDYMIHPPYRGNPHEKVTADQLAAAAARPYEVLRQAHVADYQKLFGRASLDLGGHEARKLPTDQRVARMAKDKTPDPDLEALLFQFGRYLAISSSRPGNLLSSLQGVWADGIQTPWCDQYTVDLNVQMNCWPLEIANLSECFLPTFDLIDSWRVPGAKTAKVHYNAKGWIVHTVANVWGFTSAPEHPAFGMYMGVGAWLCQPVWEHYAFTGDRDYLKRAYPVMKESAEFYLDWLVKHPKTGKLVSGPSTSPEHEYIAADGQRGWLCMGPSMDQQQIWDLFGNVIEAAKELGIDDAFVARVRDARGQLAGPQIGSDGRLMEWPEEFKDSENGGHRHLSHLFGLYPGSQIAPRATPELAAAARKALEVRLANGSSGIGWSSAWTINLFARLADGDKAHDYIVRLFSTFIAPNLFGQVSHGGAFMIDGNFGYTAGVCEMLLQSQAGEIALLPALPKAWPSGSVKGLKARGGFEVDLTWKDGKVATLTLKSGLGKRCRIRSASPLQMAEGGLKPSLRSIDANVIEFDTQAGKTYSFVALPGSPTAAAETDWHPSKAEALIDKPIEDLTINGRKHEIFQHGVKPEWGYRAPQQDNFILIHPKMERKNAPLYVVLHSAGHDVLKCVKSTRDIGNHDIYRSPDDFHALYLDCRRNQGDWWWGGMHLNDAGLTARNSGGDPTPVERRVMDTVRWTIRNYGIDPNRVYLCGISMGGSGTLGIGMRNGDVFAAIRASIPAGIEHVSHRMHFLAPTIPDHVTFPDPPLVIDESAQNDGWSNGHERFVKAMNDRKYPLVFYWGPFGHADNHLLIEKGNDLVNSFDWLNVRKNEAYPVFANATGNNKLPWPDDLKSNSAGQVNAFFRWKCLSDTNHKLEMSLFLVTPAELQTTFAIPKETTADVALRRIQHGPLTPGGAFQWTFGAAKGEGKADAKGLITIPGLKITAAPTTLTVSK